ncbi:hypothetical protein D0809_28460, partial [Flavobacterium circumlabens]
EINPFYNRVLLPEYMTGEFSWEQLLKVKDGVALQKLNITMKAGVAIDKINSAEKTILDNYGNLHHFDSLILATGSRPFVPENAQLHLPGRFTIRRKEDADRLKTYLDNTGLPAA